ncbi:MAG: hypothetical protein LW650_12000 [Planctomycetaceae bacterium]|jgi:hypothetical protein|nr:hypothetical protein [Phycisphaerales bacterium]MCE2654149.1 hypothetical protein [Planctomycetaceae bacterium]
MNHTQTVGSAKAQRVVFHLGMAALVALCAGGTTAMGQDSVSTTGGLPGDAVSSYSTGATSGQRRDYVVDLTVRTSSWGSRYQFGPVAKSSLSTANPSAQFFNHLVGATAASNRFTGVQNLLRPTYFGWRTAGQGVNTARNQFPADDGSGLYGEVDASQILGQSFGFAFMEFGGGWNTVFGDGDDENNVIGGTVGFTPRNNGRLYVSRVVAATNRANANQATLSNASMGLGGVDEAGNVHLLADGFSVAGGDDPLTTRRHIRVDTTLRSVSVNNQLRGSAGPADTAATRTLLSSTTNQTTPTMIPTLIAGRPVLLAADFANALQAETTANTVTATTAHLGAGVSARGPLSYTSWTFARTRNGTADAGTAAVLSRGPSATKTRSVSAFGVNTNGSLDGLLRVEMPTGIGELEDRDDGFSPLAAHGSLGNQEFTNYGSQVCFRGGNGPVALTVLPGSGDLLLAAGVSATGTAAGTPQSMDNYIAVARVNAQTGLTSWTIAAHTGGPNGAAGNSKAIYGMVGGNMAQIGEIAKYNEVYTGATSGPSISAPAMDRFGNVYFISTIQLESQPQPIRTVGLLRANFDPSTNAYRLELLAQLGDVVAGRNSQRNWQIQFISPADADSVDSGGLWHSSIVQDLSAAVNASSVSYGSPMSLGALLFRAKIVYDFNNDGSFIDPSAPGGAGSPDQAYNAVIAVTPRIAGADVAQIGGGAGPDGSVTGDDYIAFINAFASGDLIADVCAIGGQPFPDGAVTGDDFIFFINAFATGE